MRIVDRYILREFVRGFLGILTVFAGVLLLREILSTLTDILQVEHADSYQIILYFINKMPAQIIEVVPIAVILAMMFSVGGMAKRKEVLAIHSSGVSYLRTALPLGIVTLLITLVVFWCNEALVPQCEARARYIEKVEIKGKGESVVTLNKNVTTKGKGQRFYDMKSFDSARKVMVRPTITEHSKDGRSLSLRIDAGYAQFLTYDDDEPSTPSGAAAGTLVGSKRYWRFYDAVRRTFDEQGRLVKMEPFEKLEIAMEENLDRFLSTNKKPNEMNFKELYTYVKIQERNLSESAFLRIKTNLHGKLAFPLSVFLLGMIGYTFAVRSSIHSLVLEFGLALTSALSYYVLFFGAAKAGGTGLLPPVVAAWIANIIFAALLMRRFRELEHVPR